jgi:hypothetical protein
VTLASRGTLANTRRIKTTWFHIWLQLSLKYSQLADLFLKSIMDVRTVNDVTDSESCEGMPDAVTDSENEHRSPLKKPDATCKTPKRKGKGKGGKKGNYVIWHGETGSSSSSCVIPPAQTASSHDATEPLGSKGTLEVFSGSGHLSQAMTKQGFSAVQVDIEMGPQNDMSDSRVGNMVLNRALKNNTVYGHLAPPCNTYTRARWPKLRSKEYPEGVPGLSDGDQAVVDIANRITQNTFQLATDLMANGVQVSIENPQTSLLDD